MIQNHGDGERTLLVGLAWSGVSRSMVQEHLEELARLVETAGGVVLAMAIQERPAPDASTFVGSGFLQRLAEQCEDLEIASLVFDEDLTASQVRSIEKALPKSVKVLDRAQVILDIFALRARTREARTQVELAQLSYLLPRLTRRWTHLSRQTGGIGTRGVGETQLEIDRRLVSKRIAALKAKLAVIERDRRLRRHRRSALASVALVGYTNAGKSSLFTALSRSSVLVEDRLFATLDPRARRIDLGDDMPAILVDTVGFIRKLPHDLVAPFRSTLEEASLADVVVHVVDGSHPAWEDHLKVGQEVLDGLDVAPERVLPVINKIDRLEGRPRPALPDGAPAVVVSALTGAGLDDLRSALRWRILSGPGVTILHIPLQETAAVQRAEGLARPLARRYGNEFLDMAIRSEGRHVGDVGLDRFQVDQWDEVSDAGV